MQNEILFCENILENIFRKKVSAGFSLEKQVKNPYKKYSRKYLTWKGRCYKMHTMIQQNNDFDVIVWILLAMVAFVVLNHYGLIK